MLKRVFVILFVLAVAAQTHAGCEAELTLVDTTTLPGMPVRAFVTLHNTSAATQELPGAAGILVRAAGGEAFLLNVGSGYAFHFPHRGDASLAAHEVRPVSLGYDPTLFAGNFTTNPSFWTPGDYSLRLLFFENPRIYQSVDTVTSAMPPDVNEARARASCLSNEAVLHVVEPSGVDSELWQEIRRLAPHGSIELSDWRRVHLAPLFERFAGSKYLPFLLRWYPTQSRAERVALYERTLALPMHDSARERLLLESADEHNTIAVSEYQRRPDVASEHADAANGIYDDLLKRTKDPLLRQLVEERSKNAVTREWIAAQRH